jgi:hypothetical protein
MKANQLIAGTVIVAGLMLGAAAQAQGLGGMGGHLGGALGGSAGGLHGGITGNAFANGSDSLGRTARTHNPASTTATGPKVSTAASAVGGASHTASTGTTAASTATVPVAQPPASRGGVQVAGGASASKSGVDTAVSAQR